METAVKGLILLGLILGGGSILSWVASLFVPDDKDAGKLAAFLAIMSALSFGFACVGSL